MTTKPFIPEFERLPLDMGVENGPELERLRLRLGDLSQCRAIVDKGAPRPSAEQLAKALNDALDDLEYRMAMAVRFPAAVIAGLVWRLLENEKMFIQACESLSGQIKEEISDLLQDGEMSLQFLMQTLPASCQAMLQHQHVVPSDEDVDPIDMETLGDVLKYISDCSLFVAKYGDELPPTLIRGIGAAKYLISGAIERLRPAYPQLPQLSGVQLTH